GLPPDRRGDRAFAESRGEREGQRRQGCRRVDGRRQDDRRAVRRARGKHTNDSPEAEAAMKRSLLALLFVLLGCSPLAFSQAKYPAKPVTIVVPYPPGGSND